MITRRQFVQSSGATVVLLLTTIGCAEDDDDGAVNTTNPTEPSGCDGVGATSSRVENHTHELCVPLSDLTNPPPAGMSYSTNEANGHHHTVTLDAEMLARINRGETVAVATSITESHNHEYSLVRAASSPPPSPPSGGGPY